MRITVTRWSHGLSSQAECAIWGLASASSASSLRLTVYFAARNLYIFLVLSHPSAASTFLSSFEPFCLRSSLPAPQKPAPSLPTGFSVPLHADSWISVLDAPVPILEKDDGHGKNRAAYPECMRDWVDGASGEYWMGRGYRYDLAANLTGPGM